ncbi:MAG TPA: 30S ribosomal protein S15 [Thermodesulfobacteriota bacterium]|jgi:small subunit ribosomal protein S15|nr:30S ribosomal protein S15 [Thermodesulfobacteriota bacterium]
MALEKEEKSQLISDFRLHEKDVGSPEVQIAILTRRIQELSKHMQSAPQDFHSKRGLLSIVAKRRKLLDYVKQISPERYGNLLDKLRLRK